MESAAEDKPWTMSVPEAAKKYFDITSKDGAYGAVRAGVIPVIKVGRRYRVPIAVLEKKLGAA
jgi:hypothetical protein